MVAQIVTIAQQKGGAGKTTTAAHLAVAWAQYGLNVAILDIDPQGSLTHWYELRERYVRDSAPIELRQSSGLVIGSDIAKLKREFDFVIVDSPPHVESEARTAIRHSDLVIVPMQPSPLDLWATKATIKIAKQEKVPVKMVLNRVNTHTRLTQRMQEEMKDMSLAMFGNRVDYASAIMTGKGITEYAPSSPAAKEVIALAEELLDYFGYDVEEDEVEAAAG